MTSLPPDADPPRLFGSGDLPPALGDALRQARADFPNESALSELASRLGQRRRGFGGQHVPLERFLLLHQDPVAFPDIAQLVRALGGIRRQPQRGAQPDSQRTDDQHDERNLGRQRASLPKEPLIN